MNRSIINGVVYESKYPMYITNNQVICDGDYYINGKLYSPDTYTEENLKLISQSFDISDIKSMLNDSFDIEFNISPNIKKDEVIITTTEKIHSSIKIQFKNFNLAISSPNRNIKILVQAKNMETISNSGIGNITGFINVDELNIHNKGVGSIKLKGFTNALYLENSGVGTLSTIEMFSKQVAFNNSGVGSLKFTSQVLKSGYLSGLGSVKYYADQEGKIKTSGLGSVKYLGVKKFIDSDTITTVKKSSVNKNEDLSTKNTDYLNNNVSLVDIEKKIQEIKVIPEKEEKKDSLSSLAQKFKKLL